MNNNPSRLGIDIGRVIIDGSNHPSGDDTTFFKGGIENALSTPPVIGAFDAITRLCEIFDARVWLVSKCGDRVRGRTEQWLTHHRFFETTGVPATNLRFCRQRPEKAIHCAELSITHFIDDRADVLGALEGIVPHRFLFGPQSRPARPGVSHCPDWDVAEAAVLRSIVRPVDDADRLGASRPRPVDRG
jgi:hypothetical protein